MTFEDRLRDYERLALELFRRELTPHIEKVTVDVDEDFRGDEGLFFKVYLGPEAPRDLGKAYIFAHHDFRKALEAQGEQRFPYLTTKRHKGDHAPEDIILRTPEGSLAKRRAAQ